MKRPWQIHSMQRWSSKITTFLIGPRITLVCGWVLAMVLNKLKIQTSQFVHITSLILLKTSLLARMESTKTVPSTSLRTKTWPMCKPYWLSSILKQTLQTSQSASCGPSSPTRMRPGRIPTWPPLRWTLSGPTGTLRTGPSSTQYPKILVPSSSTLLSCPSPSLSQPRSNHPARAHQQHHRLKRRETEGIWQEKKKDLLHPVHPHLASAQYSVFWSWSEHYFISLDKFNNIC